MKAAVVGSCGFAFVLGACAIANTLQQDLAYARWAKCNSSLPVVLERYGFTDYHVKNAVALARLRTEFKDKVEILQLPTPVLRDLKKLATDVVREEPEKTPMAKKVHASFTKFQALVGPWDHVAEGAYHQLVAGDINLQAADKVW